MFVSFSNLIKITARFSTSRQDQQDLTKVDEISDKILQGFKHDFFKSLLLHFKIMLITGKKYIFRGIISRAFNFEVILIFFPEHH